ncbi:MAG: UbiA-like polyprenyltransferase [candidate division NC10 bacterium]|mgnify:CR=1 FL=1
MQKLRYFFEAIKIEHTVFALPFAYISMALAAGGWPGWRVVVWGTLAMVGARTLAMSVNRLVARAIDARNPRPANRHLPRGLLAPPEVAAGAVGGGVLLLVSAWQLNPLCLKLSPLAVLFLVGYHYTKYFTWGSHWILGFTDGIAAAGGWIAVRERFELPAFLLWFAVTVWIAGFDLIYACQDVEFDRAERLRSVPARFGVAAALRWSRICHALTAFSLAAVGLVIPLGWSYWIGWLLVVALFVYEHSLVSPTNLSRVNMAFFNVNGYIAVIVFLATLTGLWF